MRLALAFLLVSANLLAQAPPRDPGRWEPNVAAFEAQDRKSPPPRGGIVFVGASSIVRWNVAEFFPDLPVVNRGFGGSEMADTTHFAARTVLPYEPRIVVLYPGENDIARGVLPETVASGFDRFVNTVRGALPATRILVIGLKPTPARWRFNDQMLETNRRLREIAGRQEGITYISVEKAMLGPDKRPRPDLFIEDGQHMTRAGYEIWTDIVRPHLGVLLSAVQAPTVVGTATDIPGVVRGGAPIERILTGFDGLDDPIGLTDGSLVFSEPGARRIHRLDPRTNAVSVLVAESNESHGVSEDSKGRLISAQAWDGSTRIGVIHPPQSVAVVADNYEGRPFSRPNDLIVARNGGVYFTDPGLTKQQAEALAKRLGGAIGPRLPPAVYYIPPGGRAIRIEDKMIRPNGIQLSRDEKTLFISDSNGTGIIAWDIQPDGLVRNRRVFGTLTGRSTRDNGLGGVPTFADGMTIDNDGRLYVATGGGVEVLGAEGRHLGTIPVRCPPADCQNLAFSGPDKRTLYIGGAGSLYRVEMIARGFTGRAK